MRMKSLLKTLMLSMLLVAIGLPALAEEQREETQKATEKKFEVRLGISGYPLMPALEHKLGRTPKIYSYIPEKPELDELYKDRDGAHYTAGNIGAEFAWNAKRWLAVCGGVYVTPFWADMYDGKTQTRIGRKSGAGFSALASVRFNYFNRPYVHLYSAVGAGFYADKETFSFQIQTVPFGVSFGGRVFGFAELGIGTLTMGGNIGIGYKF